ncbi:ATP-binding protein [Sphingomonas edaphi]|uniref:histidine kinase n=1 Tax=Sphingomonas edaphi TaxID=2315689 RepID=A0A418PYT0_9SPHN|nr:ATP-binding protein [Sphingomonas edaphi]RIX27437.1 two-component sensor histidine kinase [Sphingomonas edaphi]
MTSLRLRLFALLAAATLFVWSAAAVWIYLHTRAEVQRVLDRRLIEAATMVASLAENSDALVATGQSRIIAVPRYNRQLACQIWSLDGRLVGRSSGAPAEPLATNRPGMSERDIGGETWRVYTIADPGRGIRVSVGDSLGIRQRLIRDLMMGLLLPAVVGLGALAFLIWTAVGTGLAPLKTISQRLRQRKPADFSPLEIARPTQEILPLVEAIDARSAKLEQMRATERHFIASAAHELQTPLAGLSTHAQIALRTDDSAVRRQSLQSIAESVDRTSRLVQQLLALAREESDVDRSEPVWLSLSVLVDALGREFHHALGSADLNVEMTEEAAAAEVCAVEAELVLALKNLLSNAINHSPSGGRIQIHVENGIGEVGISVRDQGPGIASAELERVRGRFVRGKKARGVGSGLGLSIVELVASHMSGRLDLHNQSDGGLQATLWLPEQKLRA